MIENKQVVKYLEVVRSLNKSFTFYDCHAHPFDFITNQLQYYPDPQYPGVYSSDGSTFMPPTLTNLALQPKHSEIKIVNSKFLQKFMSLNIRKKYAHTGPEVFGKHMEISNIDKVLLLPLARETSDAEYKMDLIAKMFGNDERFVFGCTIPNSLANPHISNYINIMLDKYGIKAVKLHPNYMAIDLISSYGKQRIEEVLRTCSHFGLAIIIHGGQSPSLFNHCAPPYASIDNLKHINWGRSLETVVIAHAGSYNCDLQDMERDILPTLKNMLLLYDNLMVDISGLEIPALTLVLHTISIDRILFGTDALYYDQWSTMVKLLIALEQTVSNVDDCFIKIVSTNPSTTIFKP